MGGATLRRMPHDLVPVGVLAVVAAVVSADGLGARVISAGGEYR